MSFFRVSLEGSPITIDLDGELQRVGFMVTRYVEASDSERAGHRALEVVRSDPKLLLSTGKEELDGMSLTVDGVEAVPSASVPDVQPGFAFFPLDEESGTNREDS